MRENASVEKIVEAVLASPKYHAISASLVRRIASAEILKTPYTKEAIKSTKNKLHQVTGAYLNNRPDWDTCLEMLKNAANSTNRDNFLEACRRAMRLHVSTQERLPFLDIFYAETLAGTGPIHSVLDIACGLNPLAIPWMGLAPRTDYLAIDIFQDMAEFLNNVFPLFDIDGHAQASDVVEFQPDRPVDLALVLKTIPCLEQIEKTAGSQLLELLPARHMLISFPALSLGGRNKGMVMNYEEHFRELMARRSWSVRRFEFPSELAFLVTREDI